MNEPFYTALQDVLGARDHVEHAPLPGHRNHVRAGVLIPLFDGGERCLATQRSTRMKQHSGEVCFPGGKPESGDADLSQTALRETHEEVGVTGVRLLGRLSSVPVFSSEHRLEPWVGAVPDGAEIAINREVARILWLRPLDIVRGGVIEGMAVPWEGTMWPMPIFRDGDAVMYGATAICFVEFLGTVAQAIGRAAPRVELGNADWREILSSKLIARYADL